jgi:hypothetical protein
MYGVWATVYCFSVDGLYFVLFAGMAEIREKQGSENAETRTPLVQYVIHFVSATIYVPLCLLQVAVCTHTVACSYYYHGILLYLFEEHYVYADLLCVKSMGRSKRSLLIYVLYEIVHHSQVRDLCDLN